MRPARILHSAADLDAATILEVGAGLPIGLAPELCSLVQAQRAGALAALRGDTAVYGVTTGMGALSGVRLSGPEQLAHQRNLLLGRAAGGPPWLAATEVRVLFGVRLRTFLSGEAAVSSALCQRLVDFLDKGIVPAVPADGAGCAGEIIQLAHCFGPLAGIGAVLRPGCDVGHPSEVGMTGTDGGQHARTGMGQPLHSNGVRPAAEVLGECGLEPFDLGAKEGIALLAGVPGSTALSLMAESEARSMAALMTATAALSIAAMRAPVDPYDEACARGDDVLAVVLGQLRDWLCPAVPPGMLQAPVSFRVAGHVLAQVQRSADGLAAAVQRALEGVTDSPAFLAGKFTGTAGFYGIDLAAQCDCLSAAVVHACEVSAARTHRLLDSSLTGLPAQLAARPGPDAGLVAVHKRAAGEVHALRRNTTPTSVGLIETSAGQEDVQSFSWEAAANLRTVLRRARTVAACEALTAFQAASMAGPPWPPGCERLLTSLRRLVDPVGADRPLGPDIDILAAADWLAAP